MRPLLKAAGAEADGRKASRGFALLAHEDQGLSNFASIAGDKLTTFRLMAEKAADLVAARLGNTAPCRTATEPLPGGDAIRWTEPGFAARYWYNRHDPKDLILCECEMVPQSAVDKIVEAAPGAEREMTLQSIGLRSRVGKGSCQGSFCSIFALERKISTAQVGNTGAIAYTTGYLDLLGAHPVESRQSLSDPWAGLDALRRDESGHPFVPVFLCGGRLQAGAGQLFGDE